MKTKGSITPPEYLDAIRHPVSRLVIEYAKLFNFDKFNLSKSSDFREIVRAGLECAREQLSSIDNDNSRTRSAYYRQRNALSLLLDVLNAQAHDTSLPTKSACLAIAGCVEVFGHAAVMDSSKAYRECTNLRNRLFFSDDEGRIEAELKLALTDEKVRDLKQKLKSLIRIRDDISQTAAKAGAYMNEGRHLLMAAALVELVEYAPSSKIELLAWAEQNSENFSENRKWYERQISRWGEEIISAIK